MEGKNLNIQVFPVLDLPSVKNITICIEKIDESKGLVNVDNLEHCNLPELVTLAFEGHRIESLPKMSFKKLNSLFLTGNRIKKYGHFLDSELPRLDTLNVYNNPIEDLPFGKNLKPISIYMNEAKITNFEPLKKVAHFLENFFYNGSEIKEWPSGLHFKNVKIFQMQNCSLTDDVITKILENEFTECL